MSKINTSQCPNCAAHGGDTSRDNLVTFANGSKHCFTCRYHEGDAIQANRDVNSATLYLPPTNQINLVDYETAAFFVSTSDGVYTYFHYFNEVNQLVGVKSRNYSAEVRGASKHETIRYQGELTLYGLHTLQATDVLVLTEGESDAHFIWKSLSGTTDVLALPGASTAKLLEGHTELLTSYQRIVVLVDNDTAGNKLRTDIYRLIPDWLTYVSEYPKHAKDARECTPSELCEIVNNAVPHSLDTHVITGTAAHLKAVTDNEVNTRLLISLDTLPGINKLLAGGLHAGDFIGVLGNSGKGKSTLVTQIAAYAINRNVNVLYVANESSATYVSAALSKMCTVTALGDYCTVAETYNFEALMSILNKYAKSLVVVDVVNSVAPDFLAPVETGGYMRRLLKFVNNSGVGMLLSCHTTSNNEQFKPLPLRLSDAAGGRAVQRALNGVLAFSADLDNTPPNSRLVTLAKPLRNRRVIDAEPALLQYNAQDNTYYEYGTYTKRG
jgi:5S rRNA maturation endonuclease (ribonuclease M5)